MVWEHAQLTIKAGQEAAFEAGAAEAKALFLRAKGCTGMQIQRSAENPNTYFLVVEWETIEDHTVTFRNSPDFQEWRRLVGSYFEAPPIVQHTQKVV